jgi:AI-2 transport protein TqsA
MMNINEKVSNNTKIIAYLLGFISFIILVVMLKLLEDVLIPMTIAVFLTYLFYPLLQYLMRLGIPKWLGLVLIVLGVIIIYYLIVVIMISNFDFFIDNLDQYSSKLTAFLTTALEPFNISIWEFSKMSKIPFYQLNAENILQFLYENGYIQSMFDSLLSGLTDILFALIFWFFMIIGKDRFEERLKLAFEKRREMIQSNLDSINVQLQSYLMIKTLMSLIVGILVTVLCILYGIDFPVIWGLLTFILNYIPNIGSLIASILPMLVAFIEYGVGATALSFALLLVIVHNITGNVIEPHVMGRQMDLSPVFVLFSLIFWGYVWGIVGMFLAVPISAAMKILFSNISALKPLAVIIGSKGHLLILPDKESEIPDTKIIIKEK